MTDIEISLIDDLIREGVIFLDETDSSIIFVEAKGLVERGLATLDGDVLTINENAITEYLFHQVAKED